MQFGVYDLTSQTSDGASAWTEVPKAMSPTKAYEQALRLARVADVGGIDYYFFTEHHFNAGFQVVPSPNLMVAAAAGITSRIRLGVMAYNLPLYHPVRLAEEIRMLDVLSNGRIEIGVGRGNAPHEQQGYGRDRERSAEFFDESFALLRRLLEDGTLDHYESSSWQGGPVNLVPEGVQADVPPVWMTATSPGSLAKAASLGVHAITGFLDDNAVQIASTTYRDAWTGAHPDQPVALLGTMNHIFVGADDAEVERYARPHLEAWIDAGRKALGSIDDRFANMDKGYEAHLAYFKTITSQSFDRAVDSGRILCGTPDKVLAQLERRAEAGADMFQGWFQFGGLDFDAAERSMQLFCDEVAPRAGLLRPSHSQSLEGSLL